MFNDIFKSFFRTIGRILAYLAFGFVIFYLCSYLKPVKASVMPVSRSNILFNNSEWYSKYGYYGYNLSTVGSNMPLSFACDLDTFNCSNFSALVLDICSEDSFFVNRMADYGNFCNDSCFAQNFILKDMNSYCKTNSGNVGFQFRLYLPVSKWNIGSGNTRLWLVNDTLNLKSKNYNALLTFFGAYYTDEEVTADGYDFSIIDNQIKDTNKKLDDTNKKLDDTNKKLDDTNKKLDNITDMDAPDTAKTKPDDSDYQDYENAQGHLTDKISDIPTDTLEIGIDANSSNFIFDTMNKFINAHPAVFSMFIAILSIGIIKLGLGR